MTVAVRNLSFSYKTTEVLREISFDASEGTLLCVLGRNGAGKSTLFRCILGLLKGYCGDILIDGMPACTLSARELSRKISYIPQSHSTVFSFSVLDMVMMGTTAHLGSFENPGKKERAAAESALDMMNISHLKSRNFCSISGGEQQMVLIARAIAQRTKILIMDEPCSNLDYGNQIKVMKAVKNLAKQGYLIIQATHNPEHVFLFADEVLVILEGRVGAKGSAEEILTEELMQAVYGIRVNLHEIEGRKQKFCLPDEKEISYVEAI
ncbi:MAG: ABC transporter ATP-binding protein [Eubacteriales bacterium]|nr:ABC transporter ATP-binding protein [Eubacteriales bacterium]